MPMGYERSGKNCRVCIDCEPMIGGGRSYRCYGEIEGTPIKKDFAENHNEPPQVSPAWCPNRLSRNKSSRHL